MDHVSNVKYVLFGDKWITQFAVFLVFVAMVVK
jgi:hypothetical protein